MADCPQPPLRRIVHVSADFPDAIRPDKTRAIESMVRLVEDRFDNRIISLNRRAPGPSFALAMAANPLHPRLAIAAHPPVAQVSAVAYDAPGLGLYHAAMLHRLGDWLAETIARGPRPALLVGYKLGFEGLAVARAARALGVPYAITLQGNSDVKLAQLRPDLRSELARCFHGAAMVFAFAPWTLRRIEQLLGPRHGASTLVPCPVATQTMLPPKPAGDGLITAFHLLGQRNKNLARMTGAMQRLARSMPDARLAVVGGGSDEDTAKARRVVRAAGMVTLEGALPLAAMPARLNRAAGFVLPSLRESFGLVFIEALFAGTPIVYPAGWAVDGWFDGAPFALPVDNRSVPAIADAMARLIRDEAAMKLALAAWQASPAPARFCAAQIADAFAGGLAAACANTRVAA